MAKKRMGESWVSYDREAKNLRKSRLTVQTIKFNLFHANFLFLSFLLQVNEEARNQLDPVYLIKI